MSLLTICQEVADIVGANVVPNQIVGANDEDSRKLLRLANLEGRELRRRHEWQAVTKEYIHTCVPTEDQGDILTLVPDWNRPVNESTFSRTNGRELSGNTSASDWQAMKAQGGATGTRTYYRLRGNRLLLMPIPAAGEKFALEYISRFWVVGTDAQSQPVYKDSFTADADTPLFSENLIRLGMIYRWRKSVGLDYGREEAEYNAQVDSAVFAEIPRERINVGPTDGNSYPIAGRRLAIAR